MSESGEWAKAIAAAEVNAGRVVGVTVDGRSVAIYHTADGSFHATDNVCTHSYAELSDGTLEDHVIECPLHGGQFDVRTGKALCNPVRKDIAVFPCKVEDGDVWIRLPG
ncbi:MAG: non-heme iron oxygenase ferredoxin subunit [Pseudorhodoplanes sp.]